MSQEIRDGIFDYLHWFPYGNLASRFRAPDTTPRKPLITLRGFFESWGTSRLPTEGDEPVPRGPDMAARGRPRRHAEAVGLRRGGATPQGPEGYRGAEGAGRAKVTFVERLRTAGLFPTRMPHDSDASRKRANSFPQHPSAIRSRS
jgi:hypothetical protein